MNFAIFEFCLDWPGGPGQFSGVLQVRIWTKKARPSSRKY